jgi:post-segregation antitoxin (ccd killing protein)
MARINVYLPQDLADQVREEDLNVSALVQAALRQALAAQRTNAWLDDVAKLPKTHIDDAVVAEALRGAKDEFEGIR